MKKHSFLTVENKRYTALSDSTALILDLNADIGTAYLEHYCAKDDVENFMCQLKEFNCIEPFDNDSIDSDFPKDIMFENGCASMNINNRKKFKHTQ